MSKLLFFIFFLSVSCSSFQKNNDITIVDLKADTDSKILIEDNATVVKETSVEEDPEEIKITLQLYSTVYHSLGLVKLLKELDKEEIKVSSISTFGFGALISALYAKEGKVSYLEWKLFDLLKRLKEKEPYSKDWRRSISKFIDKEFSKIDFKDLKIGLSIPKLIEDKVILSDKKLSLSLKKTLNIGLKENYVSNPGNYLVRLRERGEHLVFPITFLPQYPKFEKMKNFNYGVLTTYLGKVYGNDEISKILASNKHALDKLESTNQYEVIYNESVTDYVKVLKERIEQWFEDKINQENYTN